MICRAPMIAGLLDGPSRVRVCSFAVMQPDRRGAWLGRVRKDTNWRRGS
jgi:hypothetical protein